MRRPATAADGFGEDVGEPVRGPQGGVLAQLESEPLAAAGQELELIDPAQLEQLVSTGSRRVLVICQVSPSISPSAPSGMSRSPIQLRTWL